MKCLFMTLVFVFLLAGEGLAQDKASPAEPKDKVGYSVGYQIGADFLSHKVTIDPESLARGASDAINSRKPLLTQEEMRAILIDLEKRMKERGRLSMEESGNKNLTLERREK